MEEEPLYYNRTQLAERAGISLSTFASHERANVGGLQSAREKHRGLGVAYVSRKCRNYLALVAVAMKRQPKRNKPLQSEEVA